jgi:S1-C subfamily serine protease
MTDGGLSRRSVLGLVGSTLVAGCSGLDGAGSTDGGATNETTTANGSTGTAAPTTNQSSNASGATSVYTDVYREVSSAIAQVLVESAQGAGQGTGFVVDGQHLVTNYHVVTPSTTPESPGGSEAESVSVRFEDGSQRTATVVGSDIFSDLAVVRADDMPDAADSLSFVDRDPVIGQEVVAIGNPYGLAGSVSAGIVSGTNRLIPSPAGVPIPDAIQTDAAVNPGNSGGPLVGLEGDVLGVVNSGGGDNIAFAISAPLAERVVPALIESGSYEHSFVGVSLTEVTPLIARANDLPAESPTGLIVQQVSSGSPADGVLQGSQQRQVDGTAVPVGGDVITAIGGQTVNTLEAFAAYLALETSPGDTVPLTIRRNGGEQTVRVTLTDRPRP